MNNIKENRKQYARNHVNEKTHFVFHGECLGCVTPLHYGIGNCVGCLYFNGVTSSFPELKIKDFTTL